MKILITGSTGLLGKALIDRALPGHDITALYMGDYELPDTDHVRYRKLDIRDKEGHMRIFDRYAPEVVIHTAGVGSPDYAEKHKEETREINIGGTRNMIENCRRLGSKFIYISSNGIYDGQRPLYKEDDAPEPINYYGQIKLEGEKVTRLSKIPFAIVRPILMYGWNHSFERPNIVTYAISQLGAGKQVFAYEDVYTNPLFTASCAEAVWKIIDEDRYDIFNIAGKDRASIYELVKKAASLFQLDSALVIPVKQGFFNELVKRPRDTSYDTEKMRRVLGLEPISLDDGLNLMKNLRPNQNG